MQTSAQRLENKMELKNECLIDLVCFPGAISMDCEKGTYKYTCL